jgi:hypothetical protein
MNNAVSQAEFARLINASRSYITQLKKSGRLVLTDGGLVLANESKARIKETADPAKDGTIKSIDQVGNSYAAARAVKERYQAMLSKLQYERESGILVLKSDVAASVADIVTRFRLASENLPFRVSPELVGKDLDQIRAILKQHVFETLNDLAKGFDKALDELGDVKR